MCVAFLEFHLSANTESTAKSGIPIQANASTRSNTVISSEPSRSLRNPGPSSLPLEASKRNYASSTSPVTLAVAIAPHHPPQAPITQMAPPLSLHPHMRSAQTSTPALLNPSCGALTPTFLLPPPTTRKFDGGISAPARSSPNTNLKAQWAAASLTTSPPQPWPSLREKRHISFPAPNRVSCSKRSRPAARSRLWHYTPMRVSSLQAAAGTPGYAYMILTMRGSWTCTKATTARFGV